MIFLRLFFEFFKTGLFSIGGGLATIPFLQDMGEATGWFTNQELTTMIAVSESTPGPMGVNMATYVGYHMGCNTVLGPAGGILGAVIATLGLVAPSIIVILIIARFLQKFRHSRTVEAAFQGLRPASTALIVVAGLSVRAAQRVLHRHHCRRVEGRSSGRGGVRGHEVVAPEEAPPHLFHPVRRRHRRGLPVLRGAGENPIPSHETPARAGRERGGPPGFFS